MLNVNIDGTEQVDLSAAGPPSAHQPACPGSAFHPETAAEDPSNNISCFIHPALAAAIRGTSESPLTADNMAVDDESPPRTNKKRKMRNEQPQATNDQAFSLSPSQHETPSRPRSYVGRMPGSNDGEKQPKERRKGGDTKVSTRSPGSLGMAARNQSNPGRPPTFQSPGRFVTPHRNRPKHAEEIFITTPATPVDFTGAPEGMEGIIAMLETLPRELTALHQQYMSPMRELAEELRHQQARIVALEREVTDLRKSSGQDAQAAQKTAEGAVKTEDKDSLFVC